MYFSGNWVRPDETQGSERRLDFIYLEDRAPSLTPLRPHTCTQTWPAAPAGALLSCLAKFLEDNETPALASVGIVMNYFWKQSCEFTSSLDI